jgi:cryptochrome
MKNSIYWFRKGLRLHDNPALIECLKKSGKVYPIFILDPFYVKSGNVGPNRWRFLFEALHDLDINLRKL